MNRPLLLQLVVIISLTSLPVTMIAVNGSRTVRALLEFPVASGAASAPSDNDTDEASGSVAATSLQFGVYDPEDVFDADRSLQLRHVYLSWAAFDATESLDRLMALEKQGYRLLLTIEPWPAADADLPLMQGVLAGEYDRVIDRLAGVLQALRGPVYISWGHEMDQDLTDRYPWSGVDPQQYIQAYRYVVDRMRRQVDTETHWVWAGVLKEGSLRYWPGGEYVDFVGMPVYSYPAWDRKTYGFIRDFRTTFEEKSSIVRILDKPLMITELGISGSEDFEAFWLHQAFLAFAAYPELKAVIFFYAADTEGAWGPDVETPDWRVHPDAIRSLVQWKTQ